MHIVFLLTLNDSDSYTGAPYFASISSLKMGADLCHVFCEKNAGLVIKSYSPELMVHPYLRNSDSIGIDLKNQDRVEAEINKIVERVTSMFPRLHVLVVGPGLSRDEIMIETTKRVIVKAKENGMPLVIDADGLYLVQKNPDIIRGYPLAVLTPNANEFTRLCESVNVPCGKEYRDDVALKLSQAFGNVTILQKGSRDIISNGKEVLICDAEGSPRRCGGQGDLLSGACATFLAWGKNYEAKAWEYVIDYVPYLYVYKFDHFTGTRQIQILTTTFKSAFLCSQHGLLPY
ncbi:hypothetical protein, variant [Spizellomyces punctatus DAOM BR117]|uniref:ATP-dependent (S)-NAD(P)H-hydrate dehydratase n=1 Tax=Spizellomyces punctatus (strain DAOM BR117) TaxID=645134 RepID=A0A0L0HVF6_SPIPD|nr:hypothetical protein, variant [Spizellomyces punctatus DAOM BR117]KND04869.1 hypothetical protein, variant [Spizellomyces punctatus DAOM BR117]|eukprot:XP_016612908.1 hypothetical protein, variant [Spizellomyces punctatus DAOM BR117]